MSKVKPLPESNRILAAGWQAKLHASHQARLSQIKPLVNTRPPESTKIKIRRDKKRIARETDLERIDRENRILLERMSLIQSKPSPDLPHPPPLEPAFAPGSTSGSASHASPAKKPSLNSLIRQREQERILEENQQLIARLKRGRSNFNAAEIARHEKQYERLKISASLARAPPPAIPQPKLLHSSPSTKRLYGSESDRSDENGGLSKSQSVTSLGGRPNSSGLSTSASSKSLHSSSKKPLSPSRPLAELRDMHGPVKSIISSTYISPLHTPNASDHHSVQLKQNDRKKIDGRNVMVTVEEMTATAPAATSKLITDDSSSQSSAPAATNTNLEQLHALLFRTYDHSRLTHDYVSVPWHIIAALPECVHEPKLLEAGEREHLAERLFGRLRFHEGRLAFNPSHALRVEKNGQTVTDTPAKKKPSSNSSTPAAKSSSTWDQIGSDGQLAATPARPQPEVDENGGRISPDLSPDQSEGGRGRARRRVGTHHMAYTTASLVRAEESSLLVVKTILDHQEKVEREQAFKALRAKSPAEHARARSKSPKKRKEPTITTTETSSLPTAATSPKGASTPNQITSPKASAVASHTRTASLTSQKRTASLTSGLPPPTQTQLEAKEQN